MLCVRAFVCVCARASVILFIYVLTDITWVQKEGELIPFARDDMNWLAAHATWLASSLVHFLGDAREEWRCLTRSKGRQIRQSIMGTHVKHAKHIVRTGRYDLRSGEIGVTGPNWLPPRSLDELLPLATASASMSAFLSFFFLSVPVCFYFFFKYFELGQRSKSRVVGEENDILQLLFVVVVNIWKNIMIFGMNVTVWERECVN